MQGIALPGKAALLSVSVLYALAFNAVAEESAEINFDASFLRLGNGQVPDLTRFSRGASLSPGIHRVRVFFNEQPVVNQDVLYVTEGQRSVPCLSTDLLRQLPLRHEKLPASAYAVDAGTCISLATLIPDATVTTDSNAQTLNILVPQVWDCLLYTSPSPRDCS